MPRSKICKIRYFINQDVLQQSFSDKLYNNMNLKRMADMLQNISLLLSVKLNFIETGKPFPNLATNKVSTEGEEIQLVNYIKFAIRFNYGSNEDEVRA
ncbi:hypothetical protein HHI36_002183 [Cryptolaemus montrouzieri]|uniref:Uncharacterized protein n=1 Tax=Cryptolaemus montrouzieri TaxID=559131 RepID=A0ABD2P9P1_9CUCU